MTWVGIRNLVNRNNTEYEQKSENSHGGRLIGINGMYNE